MTTMARSELRTHRDRRRPTRPLTVLALAGAAALSGCANGSGADDDTVDVMASFYPLAYVAERVGGEAVTVENLTPGGDAHSVELSPEQVGQLDEASMVIYLSGM